MTEDETIHPFHYNPNLSGDESLISEVSIENVSHKSSVKPSEEYIETYITIPPDGGWGWIVVFGSFLCNFLVDGAMFTFGIFLTDISKTFNVKPTDIAVANSLMSGFCFLSGPVACAFVNRLGFQITGFIGGLITAFAFFTSTFTSSLVTFYIIYGVFGGLGFGMMYASSIIVIGFYFERWRALATSLAVTGSATGIVGFPLIVDGLLAKLFWQTKFIVLAVFCLIAGFVAWLYRPLTPTHVLTTKDKKIVQYLSAGNGNQSFLSFQKEKKAGIFKKIYNKLHKRSYPKQPQQTYMDSTYLMYFPPGPSSSSIFMSSVAGESVSTFLNSGMSKSILENRSERNAGDKLSTVFEDKETASENCCYRFCCDNKCRKWCCPSQIINRPMYRDDIFYGGSLYTLPEYNQSGTTTTTSVIRSLEYNMSVTRAEHFKETKKNKCCHEAVARTFATMLNLHLLKSPSFILLALSGFSTVLGIYTPFVYLKERADEINIEKHFSYYFYMAVGISNIFGRIISGIISSFPQTKPLTVSYISLLICGLSTIISYFLIDAYSHFTYNAIFGLTIACFGSLRTPIVVDLLGLENLTNAFGLLQMISGIAAFSGVPVAGGIVKLTDSYNASFIFAGCTITLSALLLIPIKMVARYENKNQKS